MSAGPKDPINQHKGGLVPSRPSALTINDERRFLQESVPEPESVRLSQLNFTDLWINEVGRVRMGGAEDAEGPLVEVPENAISDIDALRIIVMQRGQSAKEFAIEYDSIRYRVTRVRTETGVWYTLRRTKTKPPRLRELGGFSAPVMRHLGWLGEEPNKGLILLAGPTNQGKTTTASALLIEYLIKFGGIAVTIEDPPELMLDGDHGRFGMCLQQALEKGQSFASALVDAMRQTPRFIFVSEMRRPEDASGVLRTAISGHVVISTIHAGDPLEAIGSLIKLVSAHDGSHEYAREQVATGLSAVIHQRLHTIRRPGEKVKRLLEIKTLFMGLPDSNERTLVREGKISQLQTNIERQLDRMKLGRDPVIPDPRDDDKRKGR
ncbi:Flp pilus assembly complex ATPase component TadA [Agrobacterium rubi]|nr:Flp pilus assembly complex ATPase component TadA [Agrobacterium rubi]NTF24220.1 Flp pilus assembly complex ATPase component TadA [Agrobacterium rubi]